MSLPKRILKESERLQADPSPGITAVPHEENMRYFDVTVSGPGDSPFEGIDHRRKIQLFRVDNKHQLGGKD